MSRRRASLWIAVYAVVCAMALGVVWVRAAAPSAVPSASSSVEIPLSGPMTLPVKGSVKDDAGSTWALDGNLTGTFTGTITVTKTEPAPPPPGIIFGPVTNMQGTVLTKATAGIVLFLKGSGFPTAPSTFKRLTLAGQTMMVQAWTGNSVQWGIPNTVSDKLTAPLTGTFTCYEQINGQWVSKGSGGSFTIMPSGSLPAAARRAKKR